VSITEHAYKVISSDLGITSFPVPPSRQFFEGNLIQVETDGIHHTVTNLTLAGNESVLCLQEYPKKLSPLEIGNKADGIRFLLSLGLPVPPTFVLTEEFFSSVIRTNKAGSLWANLTISKSDIKTLKQRIIQERLMTFDIDGVEHPRTNDLTDNEVLRIELMRRFEELSHSLQVIPKQKWAQCTKLLEANLGKGPILYAVRSSGGEDFVRRSLAGEFLTKLGVKPKDLASAVLEVIRSPFTPEFAESVVSLPPNEGRRILASLVMSVIIMPLIDAECSGTLVHFHPITRNSNYITIEAQYEIAGVVSAVRDSHKELLQIILSADTGEPVSIKSFSNGREQALETLDQAMITAGEVEHLYKVARLIHRHKGFPQDTEWAIERGTRTAWFLQTRPA
jgi:phosphoenolpyruvate synthase/pyruvate phosphate dikinase